MSSLAPSDEFVEVWLRVSPVSGWRSGSVFTSWHTSVRRWAVRSLSSLWRIIGKPPLGQERTCWTEKLEPQTQWVGVEGGCQPYRKEIASTKALLWRQKPNSRIGNEVSQVDAPRSLAKSIAFLDDSDNLVLSFLATFWAFCSRCSLILSLASSWAERHSRSSHCFWSRWASSMDQWPFLKIEIHCVLTPLDSWDQGHPALQVGQRGYVHRHMGVACQWTCVSILA